jgi:phosphate transport system permease protein
MASTVLDAASTMDEQRRRPATSGGGDRTFRLLLYVARAAVLVLMALVGMLLLNKAFSALRIAGWDFFTTEAWEPDSHHFGIAAVLIGTMLIATVAILIAVPLATGMALYVSEYAPVPPYPHRPAGSRPTTSTAAPARPEVRRRYSKRTASTSAR